MFAKVGDEDVYEVWRDVVERVAYDFGVLDYGRAVGHAHERLRRRPIPVRGGKRLNVAPLWTNFVRSRENNDGSTVFFCGEGGGETPWIGEETAVGENGVGAKDDFGYARHDGVDGRIWDE